MHLQLLKSRAVMSEEGSCQQSKAEDTLCLFWLKSKAEDTESRHKHRQASQMSVLCHSQSARNWKYAIWFLQHVLGRYVAVTQTYKLHLWQLLLPTQQKIGIVGLQPFPNGPDQGGFLPQAERGNPLRTSSCTPGAETCLIVTDLDGQGSQSKLIIKQFSRKKNNR